MAYIEREVERSVPELKAFNLLTQAEIRQIMKERTYYVDRKFKYTRHDFLRYIQFENKLFRLVILRCQTRKDLNKNDIISVRKRFIRRINSIYNMALNRFSNDKQLWLLSFDFAKRHSERISRAKFLKALLLHPHWIEAWINAAQYEYEWNKNATNARLLYQRAISLNKKSLSLYASFFKMEILVIKQHLNWNFNESNDETFDWKKELNSLGNGSDKKKNESVDRIYSEMEVPKLIMRNAMKNIVDKKKKHVLIKRMLLMIPTKKEMIDDPSIFKGNMTEDEVNDKLAKIAQQFSELQKYIFEYLEKHYYFDRVIIELLARKNIQTYSKKYRGLSRCVEISGCQVFERAILLISNEGNKKEKRYITEILNQYIKYIKNRLDLYIKLKEDIVSKRDNDDEDELNKNDLHLLETYENVTKYLVFRLVDSFKRLHDLSATDSLLFREWILTLTKMNKFDEALKLIKLATKQYPKCVDLWKLYSNLYGRQLSICQENKERNKYYKKVIEICKKGIQCVSVVDAPQLWLNMIDVMMARLMFMSLNNDKMSDDDDDSDDSDDDSDSDIDMKNNDNLIKEKQIKTIHDTFRKGIEECLSHNNELKESYLRWIVIYHSENEEKILDTLKWFERQTMRCSPKIYKNILDIYESIWLFDIDINSNLMHRHHRQQQINIDKIARLYEKCLNEHGKTKADVWIWYIEYARKYMKISTASSIYRRAMKTLNSEGFQHFVKYANNTNYKK